MDARLQVALEMDRPRDPLPAVGASLQLAHDPGDDCRLDGHRRDHPHRRVRLPLDGRAHASAPLGRSSFIGPLLNRVLGAGNPELQVDLVLHGRGGGHGAAPPDRSGVVMVLVAHGERRARRGRFQARLGQCQLVPIALVAARLVDRLDHQIGVVVAGVDGCSGAVRGGGRVGVTARDGGRGDAAGGGDQHLLAADDDHLVVGEPGGGERDRGRARGQSRSQGSLLVGEEQLLVLRFPVRAVVGVVVRVRLIALGDLLGERAVLVEMNGNLNPPYAAAGHWVTVKRLAAAVKPACASAQSSFWRNATVHAGAERLRRARFKS